MSEQMPKNHTGSSVDDSNTDAAAAAAASAAFRLNPAATEFVPKFVVAPAKSAYQDHQQTNYQNYAGASGFNPNHYSNNRGPNYRGGGHHNYRGNSGSYHNSNHHNHHHQNHHHHNQHYNTNNAHYHNNNYHNNNHGQHQQSGGGGGGFKSSNNQSNINNNFINMSADQNEIDPIEMEARCEAVVEILQDERIRDMVAGVPGNNDNDSNNRGGGASVQQLSQQMTNDLNFNSQQDQSGEPDEDEMFEMMAMQDECRMEMMKFYIQSQNPELFSEVYHDVSYPDQPIKPGEQQSGAAASGSAGDDKANIANTSDSTASTAQQDSAGPSDSSSSGNDQKQSS